MWRESSLAKILLLAILAMFVNEICMAAEPASDATVQEMVDTLAGKKAAETGEKSMRMRSFGTVKSAPPNGQLQLSIRFELASSMIGAHSRELLAKLGEAMNSPTLAGTRFRIEGHTDATGDERSNLRLSERRAQSVRQFLANNSRVEAARLDSVGKGSSQPIDRGNPAAASNRRVVIVALDDSTAVAAATPAPAAMVTMTGGTSVGTIRQSKGDVSILRANAPFAAVTGGAMNEGDAISTAAGATVLIEMEDGAKLLVRSNTRVILSRIVNSGTLADLAHAIDLAIGAIRYVTGTVGKASPQGVRFKTPTATIGIRGTDVDIVHTSKMRSLQASGTYVRVNRGEIELDGGDGSTVVLAMSEQAFAGASGPVMRGGARAPAARKLAVSVTIFPTDELDSLMETK